LKTIIIIGSGLVIAQGIKGSGLGLVVEQSGILPYSGAGSDSGGWLVRPIGLWTHANDAAFSIFCFLLAWILIRFYKEKKTELIDQKWLLLPIIALIWLQSRSVFLAIIIVLGWWLYFYGKSIKLAIKKIRLGLWAWGVGIGIMFLSAMVVVDRFWNSVTNFGIYSGWDTRAKLLSVAVRVFSHHFWWGVGGGNFIAVAFREDLNKVMRTFPEAVHNGWMLILVEQGMVGAMIWILFLVVLIRKWWLFTKNKLELRWFLVVMMISQSVVMMFQPFQSILTLGLMLSVILLACEDNERKKSL
jgi:O-antigen ligase